MTARVEEGDRNGEQRRDGGERKGRGSGGKGERRGREGGGEGPGAGRIRPSKAMGGPNDESFPEIEKDPAVEGDERPER